MKKRFNWKTALVGMIAAMVMTMVTIAAYSAYAYYLDSEVMQYVQIEIPVTDMDSSIEAAGESGEDVIMGYVTMIRNADGEDVAEINGNPTLEQLRRLFAYQFVLYKELRAKRLTQSGEDSYLRYQELFFDPVPDLRSLSFFGDQNSDNTDYWQAEYEGNVSDIISRVSAYLSDLEKNCFSDFNDNYNYWMQEKTMNGETPLVLTNSEQQDPSLVNPMDYAFLFQIRYDEHGVPNISDLVHSTDTEKLRRDINSVLHENPRGILGGNGSRMESGYVLLDEAVEKATQVKLPAGCVCTIGMTWQKWYDTIQPEEQIDNWNYYYARFGGTSARVVGLSLVLIIAFFGAFYLNPRSEDKRNARAIFKAPFEIQAGLIWLLVNGWDVVHRWFVSEYRSGQPTVATIALFVYFLYFLVWYVGGSLGELLRIGIIKYFKEKSLIVAVWGVIYRKLVKLYQYFRHIDVGDDLRKKVLALIAINAVVLAILCCTWVLGILGVIIYSIVLYGVIIKYIHSVQQDYKGLTRMTREMAEGNLKYEPEQSFGTFESVKENLVQIRDGFDKAVQEEVRSHKMKTELITNVSHDLKTPLTAIITYINLMKDKDITDEMRVQYLDTLEKKSLRLKTLIEDLFEVSKANSGNIQLHRQNCDIVNLLKQVFYEMEDKLAERDLITRMTLPEEKVLLYLDGQKTYRIYENLFGNIAKYAMSGTRIYVALTQDEETVTVTLKNITEAEIYVPAEALTERFVRGDASRGRVEGSGLGLAIVRSFTEIQGGKLEIEIDGDLFKVTTIWRKPVST